MESHTENRCLQCESGIEPHHPFCLHCGELSPSSLIPGPYSVEIQDVPSEELRIRAVTLIKRWFPEVETIQADEAMRSLNSILVQGVDEASGERLLTALKHLKISGRIVKSGTGNWWNQLWNPGLVLSVPALLAAWGLDGAASLISLLVAVLAPVAVAFWSRSRSRPIVNQEALRLMSDEWMRLAKEYSEDLKLLAAEDSANLESIVGHVFDLHKRLTSRSLVAAAAGSEKGELYGALTDAIRGAVQISRRLGAPEEGEKEALRQDLLALKRLLAETEAWYSGVEAEDIKQVPQLEEKLGDITSGIDRIVREVRHASDPGLTAAVRSRFHE